jgi:aryl-alcohol dehydrogenase-like predicted oxidoreductase
VPIPGTKRVARLEENAAAADLMLTDDDMTRLEATFAPGITAGARYPADQLVRVGL